MARRYRRCVARSIGQPHLAALIERYALAANNARSAIDDTDEAGDADAADILTGYSRSLDKALWFLEAHTQEKE
jgi:starvation-inducible DNA-binding protein